MGWFSLFFYAKLCLILAGSHAKNALHVAGEVIGGVEIQLIGYIRNRQVFAFQQAGNFFGSEVLDEETGIMTARLDAAFREVIQSEGQVWLNFESLFFIVFPEDRYARISCYSKTHNLVYQRGNQRDSFWLNLVKRLIHSISQFWSDYSLVIWITLQRYIIFNKQPRKGKGFWKSQRLVFWFLPLILASYSSHSYHMTIVISAGHCFWKALSSGSVWQE